MRDAPTDWPPLREQVDSVPVGLGPDGVEHVTVRTGRLRRPESLAEWTALRGASLARFRGWPAARALIGLLEAGEDADVKAAGRDLTEWQRHGVLVALGELAAAAQQEYPPAARLMAGLRGEWVRAFGDREPWPPPRVREAPRGHGQRPASMVDAPPGADHVRASWGRLDAAPAARPPGKPGPQ